jgi:predicted transcriptional regulator
MGRRSKLEIMITVLEAIQNGESKPSRIMHYANISWNKLNLVIDSLLSQELVSQRNLEEPRRKKDKRSTIGYFITPKGQNVLRRFHKEKSVIKTKRFSLFQST